MSAIEKGSDDAPIFIVGMPRSGTSLIRLLLCAHPSIAISPETHYLTGWILQHPDIATDADFARFWRAFSASKDFAKMGADPGDVLPALADARTHPAVFAGLMRDYATRAGKPRYGEKTPGHERHLGTLREWFPRARVIVALRDPRAVAASLQRVPWGHVAAEVHGRRWASSAERLSRAADVLVVQYEHLVRDLEGSLRRICQYVGEEFSPAMLTPEEGHAFVTKRHHQPLAGKAVTDDRVDAWRDQLTAREIRAVEHLARAGMDAWGYEASDEPASAVEIARLHMALSWHRVQQGLKVRPHRS